MNTAPSGAALEGARSNELGDHQGSCDVSRDTQRAGIGKILLAPGLCVLLFLVGLGNSGALRAIGFVGAAVMALVTVAFIWSATTMMRRGRMLLHDFERGVITEFEKSDAERHVFPVASTTLGTSTRTERADGYIRTWQSVVLAGPDGTVTIESSEPEAVAPLLAAVEKFPQVGSASGG